MIHGSGISNILGGASIKTLLQLHGLIQWSLKAFMQNLVLSHICWPPVAFWNYNHDYFSFFYVSYV